MEQGQEVDVASAGVKIVEGDGAVDIQTQKVLAQSGESFGTKGVQEAEDGRREVSLWLSSTVPHS